MGFFNKASITFVVLNIIRVISIVAICMAFAGEIVIMANDFKGVHAAKSDVTAASPTASAAIRVFTPNKRFLAKREIITTVPDHLPTSTTTSRRAATTNTRSTTASAVETTSTTRPSPSAASASACAYIGSTSVPQQNGGILFATLERIFCCLILIFALVSEMPPPHKYTARFWQYCFPPFGANHGVGVLGIVQVFLGSTILSHSVTGFGMVAAWFLFVVGIVNCLFGLAFGAKLNSPRSILSDPTPCSDADDERKPSALRSLRLNAIPHAGSNFYAQYDLERQAAADLARREVVPPPRTKTLREKRGIQISAPMIQVPAPPIYAGRTEATQ